MPTHSPVLAPSGGEMANNVNEYEKEYKAAEDYKTLIPEGLWDVECIGYNDGFYNRTPKLVLDFELINEGPYQGEHVAMFFNMPYDGCIPTGSKYYKTWSKVNGKLPSRNAKMSPRIFLNKLFKVKTRTVVPKDGNNILPPEFHYSIVESIIECLF